MSRVARRSSVCVAGNMIIFEREMLITWQNNNNYGQILPHFPIDCENKVVEELKRR